MLPGLLGGPERLEFTLSSVNVVTPEAELFLEPLQPPLRKPGSLGETDGRGGERRRLQANTVLPVRVHLNSFGALVRKLAVVSLHAPLPSFLSQPVSSS